MSRLRSPAVLTDLLQLVKAVVAAVLAWVLAAELIGLEQAFLAPWTALLTVHATVHRTMWRGAQTVLATFLGIGVAVAVTVTLGTSAVSLGLALLLGLGLARLGVLRLEGVTVATTALFVLTSASGDQPPMLLDRLLDTVIGVSVALVVNVLVVPPLNDRSARQQVDDVDRRLGALLADMAAQMGEPQESEDADDWIERTRAIDRDLQHAWSLVRNAQESTSWNPRTWRHPPTHVEEYPHVLERLEEGVAQTRSICRHVRESTRAAQEWDPAFRNRFVALLAEVGHRVAEPDATVGSLSHDVRQLAQDLSEQDLSGLQWPLYGALIANLQMIIHVVDDVATASPVRT